MKKLIVKKRSENNYITYIEGKEETWEFGQTALEAIGKFVLYNGKELGISIDSKCIELF